MKIFCEVGFLKGENIIKEENCYGDRNSNNRGVFTNKRSFRGKEFTFEIPTHSFCRSWIINISSNVSLEGGNHLS